MREMRDSGVEWIGQIPATWSIRRLKRAISTHSGGLWGANTVESEQDVFCVRVADFDYLHLRIDIHDNMTGEYIYHHPYFDNQILFLFHPCRKLSFYSKDIVHIHRMA